MRTARRPPPPPSRSALPSSGVLLGALVDAFDLRLDVPKTCRCDLNDRTTRRQLEGARVRRWCCRFTAAAHALLASGLLPLPAAPLRGSKDGTAFSLFLAFGIRANWWDRVVVSRAEQADARALLRFAVVDLSFQATFWRLALGLPEPDMGPPVWAAEDGVGAHLQSLRERITPKPTYDELTETLGFARSSVFEWFTGSRHPSHDNIEVLARYFAERIPGASQAGIGLELRRLVGLARIGNRIASVHGRAFLIDLATVFAELTRCRMGAVRREQGADGIDEAERWVLLIGTPFAVSSEVLLHAAAAHAPHDGWSEDLARGLELWRAVDAADTLAAAGPQRAFLDLLQHLPRRRPNEVERARA